MGILGDLKNKCFTSVACGRGSDQHYTYAATSGGLLCIFSKARVLDRWIDIKVILSLNDSYICFNVFMISRCRLIVF